MILCAAFIAELTLVCRYVEIRLAWTATKFPPTPLKTGWKTAIPLNLVTALLRMRPPKLLMVMAMMTGAQPEYNTLAVALFQNVT